jgi:hypothetical protein
MKPGMCNPIVMNKRIKTMIDIKPLYNQGFMVNQDFVKTIKECTAGKNLIVANSIMTQLHNEIPSPESLKLSLSHPKTLSKRASY